MKRKKGFSLIELLAVIVILVIIALITVSTVIKIINNAKKGAAEDSTYGAVDAAKLYWVSHATFDNENESEGVTFICGNDGCKYNDDILDISGDKPTSGTITISSGNVTASDATRQLDYYKGIGAKNYTKAIKYGDGEAWDWWTCTPTKDTSDAWLGVYHTGQWYGYYWPDNNLGISPAFKIG